jgi:hypothetical protein
VRARALLAPAEAARARAPALALFTLALAACSPEPTQDGPVVSVSLWDEAAGCYGRCEGAPEIDAAVASAAGEACPERPGGYACALRQGRDRVRLLADYRALTVTSCAAVPLPTLTEILDDDTGARPLGGLAPGCVDRQHFFAQRSLIAPVTPSRTLRFRVAADATYFTDTPSFDLTRPTVGLAVARCLDAAGQPLAGCALVAGVDRTLVTITVPAGVAEGTATLRWTADGSATQSQSVTLAPGGGDDRSGSFELLVPDAPGANLTVTAQVGDLEPAAQSLSLVAPDPLQVALARPGAALDFSAPLPALAAGDPTPECRTLTLAVLAPKGAPGDAVTLKASQGTLDGSIDAVVAALHAAAGGRLATATLKLPAAPTSMLVQLLAGAGAGLSTGRELDLLPILPVAAQLVAAQPTVALAASGSAAAQVTGFALAPGGAAFLDGARVSVVVKATAGGAPTLPCGAPSPAADLACDPTQVGQVPGGCLLAPTAVKLGADGALTIPLAAGVCFAGTVTLDVYATTYASSEPCLGDRKLTAAPARLTTGPALTLTYGP